MSHKAYMVYYFIEICAKSPVRNDIPCNSSDYTVLLIYFEIFFIHGTWQ